MIDLGFMKRTEENQTQSVSTIYGEQLMKSATSTNRVNNSLFRVDSRIAPFAQSVSKCN